MLTFALAGLEKAINVCLQWDDDTLKQLARLEDKLVKIEITDWQIEFYVQPKKNGVHLFATTKKEADTIISGTLFNLFKAGCAKGENTALFKNSISIRGDAELGEKMRDIISAIDIDWEEQLSKVVGDVVAHRVGVGVRRARSFSKKTLQNVKENIKDYLQIESLHVPLKSEVEQFIAEVTKLHHAVDRAEARIKRLLAKKRDASA